MLSCSSNEVVEKEGSTKQELSFPIEKAQLLTDIKHLSSNQLAGRATDTHGNQLARQFIIQRLKVLNIPPLNKQYEQHFILEKTFNQLQASNVIAQLSSITPSKSYIVLSAHFDHLGKKGSKIFNGADDNASGVAALLSIAENLSQLKVRHNIVFLFTDAEEHGLKGAHAFEKNNLNIMNNTILNINLDMLAGHQFKTKKLHYISEGLDKILSEQKYKQWKNLQQRSHVSIKKGFKHNIASGRHRVRWKQASDHAIFYNNNIPFIYFGVGEHNNYHTENDTFDNINKDFFFKATNSIYQQIVFLDQNI